MRLILQDCFKEEIHSRKVFFYETLHLWLVASSIKKDCIQLISIPTNCLNVVFVIGHNYWVNFFLKNNTISEKRIVVITCDRNINLSYKKFPAKIMYLSHQNKYNYSELIQGDLYGFDFDLTESEILFYNTNKDDDIDKRLEASFCKL